MEYRQQKEASSTTFDIVEVNPNLIPQYSNLISRYQHLINQYDALPNGRKIIVQIEINAITKQLTELLNQTNCNTEKMCSTLNNNLSRLLNNLAREAA